MATTAKKGSRMNPYTPSEYRNFVENYNWNGGWILDEDILAYRTQDTLETYSGDCSKMAPVPHGIFSEMRQNGTWLGGWMSYSPSDKKYVSREGTEYDSTIGYQSNPCPMSIFNEMVSNGIWYGGWVYGDEDGVRYIHGFVLEQILNDGCGCSSGSSGSGSGSGDGSGDGSGSGSGSSPESGTGCPINAGSHEAGIVQVRKGVTAHRGTLTISWTSGKTVGHNNLSEASVTLRFDDPSITYHNDVVTIWENAYDLSIRGTLLITCDGEEKRFSINGNFYVPSEYHN